MQCGQSGSRNTCLSLMGALSENRFRHILNKLVNFKAANLTLPHVQHILLNQSFYQNLVTACCLFTRKEGLPHGGIRVQENGAMQSSIPDKYSICLQHCLKDAAKI